MKKQKKQPQSNKTPQTRKPNQRNTRINQPLAPVTQPPVPKRQISDLSLFFRRQESISPPTVEQRFSLQHFIKGTSIQVLVLQCSGLKMAIDKINSKISVDRNLLYSILQKYFHGQKNQLWCDKYRPLTLAQSLHRQQGQKIKSWLKVFHSYRNTVFQQSNSFIDDYFGQNSNNVEFKLLKQNGWKLKGLILKGRQGVGKQTLINCTAKDMEYEILSCGNQCNQIKFLKQKNEATQSECVKTKINKNQAQIQRTNRSITTFAVQRQQAELQSQQSKRIQLMRNVNQFYPRQEETKFFNQLNKTIQSSKVPFIMTLNGFDVPLSLKIYDVIEFEEAKTEDIATLLYLIYNLQQAFSRCLDLEKIVQKERFKQTLNEQLTRFQFQINSPFIEFVNLVEIFNKKLVSLFTFVQNSILVQGQMIMGNKKSPKSFGQQNGKKQQQYKKTTLNLNLAQQMMGEYLKRADQKQLMNDYFLTEGPSKDQNKLDENSKDSKDTFPTNGTLQISKYLIDTNLNDQKKHNDSGEIPTFVSTPNKDESFDDGDQMHLSRTKTVVKNHQLQHVKNQQIIHANNTKSFSDILYDLKLKVISDYSPQIQSDESYYFSKLYNKSGDQLQQELLHNIPMQRHKIIRKSILKNVKKEFYQQHEMNTTIKQQQLGFLGFLIDSRSRVSRKKTVKQDLNLKKLLKQNEINYMKQFTEFIKPNHHSQKS